MFVLTTVASCLFPDNRWQTILRCVAGWIAGISWGRSIKYIGWWDLHLHVSLYVAVWLVVTGVNLARFIWTGMQIRWKLWWKLLSYLAIAMGEHGGVCIVYVCPYVNEQWLLVCLALLNVLGWSDLYFGGVVPGGDDSSHIKEGLPCGYTAGHGGVCCLDWVWDSWLIRN